MLWPGAHGMINDMAWRSLHDICYGLDSISSYVVWPGGHRMVYGMAYSGYISRHLQLLCAKRQPSFRNS